MIYAERIRHWAHDRNLIHGSTTQAQFVKLIEEVGELAQSIAKDRPADFRDAIGDCFVVLTILAAQKDEDIEECIALAWDVIKDRKGRMIDGIFVREEDLQDAY
jgi:NTP pyrophosphatase (non-canonical NTP hydrolase)